MMVLKSSFRLSYPFDFSFLSCNRTYCSSRYPFFVWFFFFLRQFKCALLIFLHFSLVYWIKVIFCVLSYHEVENERKSDSSEICDSNCDVSRCWISYSWRDCNWNGPIIHFIVELPCFIRAFRSRRSVAALCRFKIVRNIRHSRHKYRVVVFLNIKSYK